MMRQAPPSSPSEDSPRRLYLGAAIAAPLAVALWGALIASIMWRL